MMKLKSILEVKRRKKRHNPEDDTGPEPSVDLNGYLSFATGQPMKGNSSKRRALVEK
jgi:hypothetical protein